jgi:NAD(P)-dependent dehydrogenase (short-subunit alcohol dehydrogenase family)
MQQRLHFGVIAAPRSQQQEMTRVEQPVRSRIRFVGASVRSDTLTPMKRATMTSERKVVVVTGASGGIGAQLAKAYRHIGYQVIASSRSMRKSDDPAILVIEGDITRPETAERILGTAAERFGRIDTLVNNAGVFIAKPFTEYSEKDFATMIAVNLAGFFHLSQRAAASMLQAGSGHIVNISATIAEQPVASLPAALAALTKGGLNAATRSLAIEYAGRRVRVNAVSAGATKTPMHSPAAYDFLSALQPMGRMAETQEIVDAVMFLEKAAFVTGEILHVDGGWSAGRG